MSYPYVQTPSQQSLAKKSVKIQDLFFKGFLCAAHQTCSNIQNQINRMLKSLSFVKKKIRQIYDNMEGSIKQLLEKDQRARAKEKLNEGRKSINVFFEYCSDLTKVYKQYYSQINVQNVNPASESCQSNQSFDKIHLDNSNDFNPSQNGYGNEQQDYQNQDKDKEQDERQDQISNQDKDKDKDKEDNQSNNKINQPIKDQKKG